MDIQPSIKPTIQSDIRFNILTKKDMNQVQLAIGFQTFGELHPDRIVIQIIQILLGGNMSSRLFQVLRDEYGLAYNVMASCNLYNNIGQFAILAGVDGSNIFSGNMDKKKGKGDPITIILIEIFKLTTLYIIMDRSTSSYLPENRQLPTQCIEMPIFSISS